MFHQLVIDTLIFSSPLFQGPERLPDAGQSKREVVSMTTDQLEAFLAVAQYQSYRAAAEKLYLSQPSLSSRIQALERELGTTLFDRNGRGVVLSEKGRIFVPYAKRMKNVYLKARSNLHLNSGS